MIRRLSNLHKKIGMEERIQIVEKLIKQLTTSGYSRQQARQAVVSQLTGYKRKVERKKRTGEEMFRSAASTLKPRLKRTGKKDRKRDDGDADEDDKKDGMRKCREGRGEGGSLL